MKKINLSVVAGIFGICIASSSQVFALGLGATIQSGGGSGTQTIDDWSLPYDEDVDIDTFNIGFTLDTSLTNKHSFNYRLGIGGEAVTIENQFGDKSEISGAFVTNDFGIAVYKDSNMRIWLGPQLKVGIYSGNDAANNELAIFTLGVGPVIGANFKTSSKLVFAAKAGVIFNSYFGDAYNAGFWQYDVDGDAALFIVNFSIFYDK